MKSFCEVLEMREESELKYGFDFRLPQYRREVFLRFYEFHLKYRAHAGGVYYSFPHIWKKKAAKFGGGHGGCKVWGPGRLGGHWHTWGHLGGSHKMPMAHKV